MLSRRKKSVTELTIICYKQKSLSVFIQSSHRKKISSLRNLYQKWLTKANKEKDAGKIGMFKNIARVIMNVIDKLLAKLQRATDKKPEPATPVSKEKSLVLA
jgi:hypothetical protein